MNKFRITLIPILWISLLIPSTITVTGKVVDKNNNPIPDVSIFSEELGTTSNQYGLFTITVPKKSRLTFNHIGFRMVEVTADETYLLIKLSIDILEGQDINISANRAIPGVTPVAYSSLNPEEIEIYYTLEDVPMVLSYEPGVYAWSESGNGTGYSYVSIRGFDQSQIAVMLDNVPMNDNESHQVYWVDHGDILSDAIDVQIQRGIGNSLYGASAFGGSINIQTKIKSDTLDLTGKIGFGSFNSNKYSVNYNSGNSFNPDLGINFRVSQIESDGYREYHHTKQKALSFGIEYKLNNLINQFRSLIGHQNTDLIWDGVYGNDINNRELRRKGYKGFNDDFLQQVYSLNSRMILNENSQLKNTLYYVLGEGYYEAEKIGKEFYSYNLDFEEDWADSTTDLLRKKWIVNSYFGIVPSWIYRIGNIRIDLGGELRIYQGDHFGEISKFSNQLLADVETPFKYYQYFGKKISTTGFIHTLFYLNPELSLVTDIQFVSHKWTMDQEIIGHAQGHQISADWNFFNPKVGLNYQVADNFYIFGNVGKSEKEPADDQIINADEWEFSAKGAYPEKIMDYELGFNFSFNKIHTLINLYRINLKNEVMENIDFEEQGYYIYSQTDKTVHQGLEFELGYNLNPHFLINWNATLNQNYFEGGEFDKNLLPNNPETLSNMTIIYKPMEKLKIHTTVKYVGKQFIDNINTQENAIDSYYLVDLGIIYSIGPYKVVGKINNLLDKLYITHGEYWGAYWPGATRNAYISFEYQF